MNVEDVSFKQHIIAEEIIDPNYVPKVLPTYIRSLRAVLFGDNPDRSMLNYRVKQLLAMIHASELAEFVTDLDPRITYNFETNTSLSEEGLNNVIVEQVSGTASELILAGAPSSPDRLGQMLFQWRVSYTSPTTTITRLYPYQTQNTTAIFTAGVSQEIPLLGSNLTVRHKDSTADWTVTHRAKPKRDLGELMANIDTLGETTFTKLFNVSNSKGKTEPFQTFYNLWRQHYALPYRLGAVVLAMGYQTDEL